MSSIIELLKSSGFPGEIAAIFITQFPQSWIWWFPAIPFAAGMALRFGASPTWFPHFRHCVEDFTDTHPRLSDTHRKTVQFFASSENRYQFWISRAQTKLSNIYSDKPFSLLSFDRALIISACYPFAFLLLLWGFGFSETIDEAVMLPQIIWWRRWLVIAMLIATYPLFIVVANNFRIAPQMENDYLVGFLPLSLILLLPVFIFVVSIITSSPYSGVMLVGAVISMALVQYLGAGAFVFSLTTVYIIYIILERKSGTSAQYVVVLIGTACIFIYGIYKDEVSARSTRTIFRTLAVLTGCVILPLLAGISMPLWGPWRGSPNANFGVQGAYFIFVFFLWAVPILNAVLNWISVGVTQWCISSYFAKRFNWWHLLAVNMSISLCLMAVAYTGCVALIFAFSHQGWRIDAGVKIKQLIVSPWGLDSLWITAMATITLVPSLLHLGMALYGILIEQFSPIREDAPRWISELDAGKPLSRVDAHSLASYLTVDRWITAILIISFLPPIFSSFSLALPKILGFIYSQH